MLKRTFAVSVCLLIILGSLANARAQQYTSDSGSQPARPFNGFFSDLFGSSDDQPAQNTPTRPYQNAPREQFARQHQSSFNPDSTQSAPNYTETTPAPTRAPTTVSPQRKYVAASDASVPTPDTVASPPAHRVAPLSNQASGSSDIFSFNWGDGASSASSPGPKVIKSMGSSSGTVADAPAVSGPPALHQRLTDFRNSPFGDAPIAPNSTSVQQTPSTTTQPINSNPIVASDPPVDSQPRSAPRTMEVPATEHPIVAPPAPAASSQSIVESKTAGFARSTSEDDSASSVLIARKSPILSVETLGPRKIVVGKQASYEVTIQNSGEVAAEDVTVYVSLPEWADIANASASAGEMRESAQTHGQPTRWVVGRVEAKGREKLSLKIIPRESKPFELAVKWDFKPALSQATIEVQEPKLAMQLDGPREVNFGKREMYKLKISNTGNGAADNVVLTLMPLNAGDTQPISHRLGILTAGEERSIEVELTARQAGSLTIQVSARGDGNSHAELAEKIVVHRAALTAEMEGPAVQYVGTPASYKVHLRNQGDAVAKNVKISVTLPTGVKYLSGTDGARTSTEGNRVQWTLDRLDASSERDFVLKCNLALSGVNRLELLSTADDELVATGAAVTQVEAMADLRLDVVDPEGPVAVGSDATYELHLRNRGTRAAENVEVMAYFSNGIEPIAAEGQLYRITPGQVVFNPISAVAPATEVVIKIRARAGAAGNHIFRAEVHCKPLGTRLVREETTHFYQEGLAMEQPTRSPTPIAERARTHEEVRTVDRRPPLPLPQAPAEPLQPSGHSVQPTLAPTPAQSSTERRY